MLKKQQIQFLHSKVKYNDPFFRKKFSSEVWGGDNLVVLMPIVADYVSIKPKNLLIALFVLADNDAAQIPKILWQKVHIFFMSFFPVVDIIQELKQEVTEQRDILDMVNQYLVDRKIYPVTGDRRSRYYFAVIHFWLFARKADHTVPHLYYFTAKIQKEISHLSKIIRNGYNSGYIILRGRDALQIKNIKKIISQFSETVDYKTMLYPEQGYNLFHYQ